MEKIILVDRCDPVVFWALYLWIQYQILKLLKHLIERYIIDQKYTWVFVLFHKELITVVFQNVSDCIELSSYNAFFLFSMCVNHSWLFCIQTKIVVSIFTVLWFSKLGLKYEVLLPYLRCKKHSLKNKKEVITIKSNSTWYAFLRDSK